MTLKKQVSLHGDRAYISTDNMLVGKGGLATGGEGKPAFIYPSADVVSVFDDFLVSRVTSTASQDTGGNFTGFDTGDTTGAGLYFNAVKGDTGASGALVASGGAGGVYRLTTTQSGSGLVRNAGMGIVSEQLFWQARGGAKGALGRLRFACRVTANPFIAAGKGGMFMGFTDTLVAQVPAHDTGGGVVTAANNCLGFMWSSDGDTGWVGVGAKNTANDSGDQHVILDAATPVSDGQFRVFEVDVVRTPGDTGGVATFYIDGLPVGSIISGISTDAALTPVIYAYDTGGARTVDIDWINVSMPRDTGSG